jgi:creatinine amidohydrolase
MALFPGQADWSNARAAADLVTDQHEDMHAGELETSILLHALPEVSVAATEPQIMRPASAPTS